MSDDTKSRIFEAAAKIIKERTVDDMTLEEVAKEAGISKGGLLYHFPSKEDLIEGLVAYYEQLFTGEIEQEMGKMPEGEKRPLTAYINAAFNFQSKAYEISQGVLAASLLSPGLLAPVQKRLSDFTSQYDQHLKDEDMANIVRLAADGLWLEDILELNTVPKAERDRIKEKLIQLAKEVEER
ncbi:TetR/AcrR family transcriptional regulator [Natranaerobius thermophilus]|uniref:Transcriptional regulator, TetR family n=1 Tax=Natranaerobius thermophilus (strain ATCC BAA-1301 / DSM 18059 / JW/NM-WN-LF) TaxID=457570 RepID=B2A6T6_NATTJ|nr:TetR/AcrR family transcriptional regulator [Natranaerobius thermophilus]ACB84217.1 transcriptional regulator, TetR family [Natranaerobius thermophilus JW/NM-WN-LF]